MSVTEIDSKGRVVIPASVRRRAGLGIGSRLKARVENGAVILTRGVEAKEFIREMEGVIREGSAVDLIDPVKLKEIWLRH